MTDQPTTEDRRARGLALMREMIGDEGLSRIEKRNEFAPDWHRWTTEVLFGDVWQGSGLDRKHRSMITVAALVPMTRTRELTIHLRAALTNGVEPEELVAIIQHVGFYAGWPAVGEALTILREVLDSRTGGGAQ